MTHPERRIVLTGASNFRDLGGYPTEDGRSVRWRRVFRADALHDLSAEDVEQLLAFGVVDIFDLRTVRELELFGTNPLADRGVRHHHVPFLAEIGAARGAAGRMMSAAEEELAQATATAYLEMLENANVSVRQVLEHMVEAPDSNVVFHCTGGRDRTGLIAALLLSALGVRRTLIASDYALTSEYLSFPAERIAQLATMYGEGITFDRVPPTLAEAMELTLVGLDERYGSPENYLRQSGITSEHQEALRRSLLEAP